MKIAGFEKGMRSSTDEIQKKVNTDLIVQTVYNIPALEEQYKPHGIRYVSKAPSAYSLFADHADVNQDPKNKSGAEFIEGFDVKGSNGRIQLTAYVELKGQTSGMPYTKGMEGCPHHK